MGGTSLSMDDYKARSTMRASYAATHGVSMASATMAYSHAISTGAVAATVHPSLSPKGTKLRESRDSAAHPVTVPIILSLDTTGSMAGVPLIIQQNLPKLMGRFIDDKASGKRYLGDGYPAIMVSAVDDYDAQGADGCLQVGQFESGIEIDDNLTNLWLTGQGGGTYQESYELALYFAARHTVHDNMEKRGRKGYMFIIGDEKAYDKVSRNQVNDVISVDPLQADIPLQAIVDEVKEKYHLFFIIPKNTSHYNDPVLYNFWVKLLGQQNVLKLEKPEAICDTIVGAVAICEEHVGVADLAADGLDVNTKALANIVPAGSGLTRYDAGSLPAVAGSGGGTERL